MEATHQRKNNERKGREISGGYTPEEEQMKGRGREISGGYTPEEEQMKGRERGDK